MDRNFEQNRLQFLHKFHKNLPGLPYYIYSSSSHNCLAVSAISVVCFKEAFLQEHWQRGGHLALRLDAHAARRAGPFPAGPVG